MACAGKLLIGGKVLVEVPALLERNVEVLQQPGNFQIEPATRRIGEAQALEESVDPRNRHCVLETHLLGLASSKCSNCFFTPDEWNVAHRLAIPSRRDAGLVSTFTLGAVPVSEAGVTMQTANKFRNELDGV